MPYFYQSDPSMLVIEGELEINITKTAEENFKKMVYIAENIGAFVTRDKGDEKGYVITANPPFSNKYYKLFAVKRPNNKMMIETIETWSLISSEWDTSLPSEISQPEAHQAISTIKEVIEKNGGVIKGDRIGHGAVFHVYPPASYNANEYYLLVMYEDKKGVLRILNIETYAKIRSQKFLRTKDFA